MSDATAPFVLMEENRAAAQALALLRPVSGSSGAAAPAIFLTGPSGCGKSHLIRHQLCEIRRSRARFDCQSVTANQLAADLRVADSDGTLASAMDRLAALDALIVDECEWLDGRLQDQVRVRHVIDRMHLDGGKLVFASRMAIGEFERCLPALANRWQGGIIAAVGLPGAASREALLQAFAAERQLALSEVAIKRLRDALLLAPRELRQVIADLDAHARRTNSAVDGALVDSFLIKYRGTPIVAIEAVIDAVAREFGVSTEDLTSRSRHQGHVIPRQCAMLLVRELTGRPLDQIGAEFGRRNRTTIAHGCERVEKLLPEMPSLRQRINRLRRTLCDTRLPRRA